MKTNPSARWILKIRFAMICLSIALLAMAELEIGEALVSRVGQITTIAADVPPAPSIGISDLMAAAR
jgi:hypothetical protein